MVSTLLLGLVIVLLLAYTAWKDLEHRRQMDRMALLLKSKDVPEFIQAETKEQSETEAEPAPDLANPEDVSADELIRAVANQQPE